MWVHRLLIAAAWALVVSASVGSGVADAATDVGAHERDELLRYAADTWRSLAAMTGDSGLPADRLLRDASGRWVPATHTSPTDIAAYLWSVVAAEDLRILDRGEAARRLGRALDGVGRLGRSHGFFFNWYDVRTGQRLGAWPTGGRPLRPFLSTVNNAWLAAALTVVGNAQPDFHDRVEDLLDPMDFRFFYEPYDPADVAAHPGQLRVGFFDDTRTFTPAFYGMLNSEARIATYLGIARGNCRPSTITGSTGPRRRIGNGRLRPPAARSRAYRGVPVFEGHYTYHGLRLVPSWGGSMFEALMVPLFVPEEQWAPESWGVNHPLYVQAQREYGMSDLRCGSWGFSPARPPAALRRVRGRPDCGQARRLPAWRREEATGRTGPVHGVVAPYASFLALRLARSEALANLRWLARRPAAYSEFGFVRLGGRRVRPGLRRRPHDRPGDDPGRGRQRVGRGSRAAPLRAGGGRGGGPAPDRVRAVHRRRPRSGSRSVVSVPGSLARPQRRRSRGALEAGAGWPRGDVANDSGSMKEIGSGDAPGFGSGPSGPHGPIHRRPTGRVPLRRGRLVEPPTSILPAGRAATRRSHEQTAGPAIRPPVGTRRNGRAGPSERQISVGRYA